MSDEESELVLQQLKNLRELIEEMHARQIADMAVIPHILSGIAGEKANPDLFFKETHRNILQFISAMPLDQEMTQLVKEKVGETFRIAMRKR